MNKFFVSIAALAVVGSLVWAQQEAPRPGQGPKFDNPQGARGGGNGGGGGAIAVSDKYVFVLRGDVVYKFNIDTMVKLSETKLPTVVRGNRTPEEN